MIQFFKERNVKCTCLVYETSENHARVTTYVGMETGDRDGSRHALNFPETLELFEIL